LLLATGDNPASVDQLMARWKARGDGIDKVAVFVPPLDRDHFLLMLKLSDVILDTIHFNGMNSSLEGFAMGTPIVTLPKAFQRGRHTQAMYRRMGYTELIASDEADYVRLVVRLATDAAFRARASQTILDRCGVLYREEAVVRGFEQVLIQAFEQRVGASSG
jgi:predicted O-linked N-acetylglucosamine transferase (SPINDLY family)